MARVVIATCLFVFMTVWSTVYGTHIDGQECKDHSCKCCEGGKSRCVFHSETRTRDYCLDGCKDGIWGHKCYNPCPSDCATCDQDSRNQGYPCTSCKPGMYGLYCNINCNSYCTTCTQNSTNNGFPCTKCRYDTNYGVHCNTPCSAGCVGGTCKIDGSCFCKAGYTGNRCEEIVCPKNCQECTTSTKCQLCVNGYYNGYLYGSNSGEYTYVCKHQCLPNCKACTGYYTCTQCEDGRYGEYCQNACSSGCQPGTCKQYDGNCNCTSGFNGNNCDQCITGKYSVDCSQKCLSQNCNDNTCIRDSGRCSACSTGYYGYNLCDKSCSTACKYGTCDFRLGTCDCVTGYSGDKCCVNNDRCITCSTPSACSQCKTGYSGDKCDYVVCPDNCKTCTPPTNCQTCVDGYYKERRYAGSNGVCKNCRPLCKTCIGYNSCNQCDDGYYGDYCETPCSSGCQLGRCIKESGTCNCKYGFRGDNCDQCIPGKYSDSCNLNCLSQYCTNNVCIRDSGRCTSCSTWYYGYDLCDKSCSTSCKYGTCDFTLGTCDDCITGYSGDKCCLNNDNCETCVSTTQCSKCKSGYSGDKCCVNNDKCITCSSPLACSKCKSGYSGDKCCLNNDNCETCVSTTQCSMCRSGYSGDKCCVNNDKCITCSSPLACHKCKSGYSGDKCCLNNDNCETCVSTTQCSMCRSGYSGDKCCVNNDRCITCSSPSACSQCMSGYSGDKCCVHNDNCETCSSDTQCSVCKSGYSGDKCCVNNDKCMTCLSPSVCSQCRYGYSGDKCCVNNDKCITCTSLSACSECKPGYSGDKCCLPNTFCDTCLSPTKCSKCIDRRHGITCEETCPDDCADTACRNDGFCNSCKAGFYGKKCENECLQNCKVCNPNGECKTCLEGYYGMLCDKCFDNCAKCNSQNTCLSCVDGYFGHNCDRCPPNCVTCSSSSNCNKCNVGYYGYTCQRECSKCKNGTKCRLSDGYCEEACKDGIFGTYCNKFCDNGCLTCQRSSGSSCTVCATGRYGKNSWNEYYNCDSHCSSNCLNNACNGSTGYCETCIAGYKGDLCDCPVNCHCTDTGMCSSCDGNFANINMNCTECALHKYGVVCQSECSNKCLDNDNNTKCHRKNGTCRVGCVNGFYGDQCDSNCDDKCVNGTCSMLGGICSNGCKHGFTDYGAECVIAAASADPDNGGSSGAVIGGSIFAVIAVLAIVGVLLFVYLKRHRANNDKFSSPHTNEGRQNHSNNISDSVLGYDNTTESVNMNTADADENINNVVQPASSTNYNKSPGQPKPKAEHERKSDKLGDLRKSVKSDFLQISAQSQDVRKSTKSVASNDKLEIKFDDVDTDVVKLSSTATEGNYGYYNLAELKRGIPVAKLADLVAKRDTANFEQEFKEFDNGLVRPYLDSQKPQNRGRNRYQHIYPYDEHRVHLQGSSTDYINASYIDGYQHPKEYIACLGPTEKATEDFVIVWMMIWEQKVEKIVMVTNLFENAAMKCEQYWPDVTTSLKYGDVTVTCHSEDEYADYTLRSFTVSKGSENRSLHHIHYTAWPDKGVPDNVTSIIEFRQRVNSIQTKLKGPVIVHCSAGIGRTGTYIALDSLTKEGQYTQSVDIYGCVKKMREQRVNMVQTSEQYHYLHSAVVHSLTFDCAAVTAEQFNKHFNNLNDKTIAEKFKQLQLTVENRSEEETKAIAVNKKHKHLNHAGADIPGVYRRPKLHLNKDPGDCDYINAVFVNSFKTKNRFIVAMTPLPGTVLDFLTLLYQENCSCIVSLEAPESLNDKNVGTYYPADNQELKHDVFKVTCTKGVPSDSYVMRKLTITYNRQAESTSKTFTHFQFTKWSRRSHVPSDTATFLQLISDVEAKANATADNGPILIHCLNGASRSGLFCAVSILRQKMEIEHEVSVVNTVRYIKSRRPSSIPNKDQFAFCHQSVVAYLDTFDKDIYSNFSLKL